MTISAWVLVLTSIPLGPRWSKGSLWALRRQSSCRTHQLPKHTGQVAVLTCIAPGLSTQKSVDQLNIFSSMLITPFLLSYRAVLLLLYIIGLFQLHRLPSIITSSSSFYPECYPFYVAHSSYLLPSSILLLCCTIKFIYVTCKRESMECNMYCTRYISGVHGVVPVCAPTTF